MDKPMNRKERWVRWVGRQSLKPWCSPTFCVVGGLGLLGLMLVVGFLFSSRLSEIAGRAIAVE